MSGEKKPCIVDPLDENFKFRVEACSSLTQCKIGSDTDFLDDKLFINNNCKQTESCSRWDYFTEHFVEEQGYCR